MSKRCTFELWPLLVVLGQLGGWLAEQNYQALPEVLPTSRQDAPGVEKWPAVSVIVPARNEEVNLPGLLDSLVNQDYPRYEVLVIDDASTDATATVARRYTNQGVGLLQCESTPNGWTGKNYACWLGVQASTYPWLLFVDADVQLASLALRSSMVFALERHLEALSLFAQQCCETLWERLLLPIAYLHYFVGVSAQRIHSTTGPALANGQYFLIRRVAYLQAGGHAANAASVIDDVALATRLKKTGVIPFACRSEQLLSIRMYTGLGQIIQGFSKNSYLFLRQSPITGAQTAVSTTLAAAVLSLLVRAVCRKSWFLLVLGMLAYLAQVIGVLPWFRRFGIALRYALLAPFSALVFLAIALNSMLRVLAGRPLAWKGRKYRATPEKRVRYRLPRRWIMDMGRALLLKTPRSIIEDSALAVRALPNAPRITGTERS